MPAVESRTPVRGSKRAASTALAAPRRHTPDLNHQQHMEVPNRHVHRTHARQDGLPSSRPPPQKYHQSHADLHVRATERAPPQNGGDPSRRRSSRSHSHHKDGRNRMRERPHSQPHGQRPPSADKPDSKSCGRRKRGTAEVKPSDRLCQPPKPPRPASAVRASSPDKLADEPANLPPAHSVEGPARAPTMPDRATLDRPVQPGRIRPSSAPMKASRAQAGRTSHIVGATSNIEADAHRVQSETYSRWNDVVHGKSVPDKVSTARPQRPSSAPPTGRAVKTRAAAAASQDTPRKGRDSDQAIRRSSSLSAVNRRPPRPPSRDRMASRDSPLPATPAAPAAPTALEPLSNNASTDPYAGWRLRPHSAPLKRRMQSVLPEYPPYAQTQKTELGSAILLFPCDAAGGLGYLNSQYTSDFVRPEVDTPYFVRHAKGTAPVLTNPIVKY